MANPFMTPAPWVKIPKTPDQTDLLYASLQGTGIEQAPLEEMSTQAAPMSAPAPTTPVQAAKAVQAPAPPIEPTEQSFSMSQKTSGTGPEAEALRTRLEDMRLSRMQDEQGSIEDYGKKIQEYEARPTGIDWRPLAGLLDQWAGGKAALTAAEAMKPETPELKREKLQAMREKLSGMKGSLSKTQYDALKDQLDSIKSEQSLIASEKRLQESLSGKQDTQGRLRDRDDDKDLMEFQKRIQPFQKVDNTVGDVERVLGFNLSEFDESSGTVRGEKTDAPGINIPILGRINQATPEGRQFKAALARLMNTVLKERSGAAVTESEEQRMLSEFANGRYKFNSEADLLATLKSFQSLLAADKKDVMAGFRPEIPDMYYSRQGLAKDYQRTGGAKPKPAGAGLTPDKAARLEELRKKLGK
jgi:hypothetical protein